MKGRKKPLGTKAQIRAEKEKSRRIATAIFLIIILSTVAISAYFAYTILNPSTSFSFTEPPLQFKPENQTPGLKAAVVDQLSLTLPNQTFVNSVTGILEGAGYTVGYYSGEKVTVDFYRCLPTHNYTIIILRVHATQDRIFFTSEPYSKSSYVWEQLQGQVWGVSFEAYTPPYYFGVGSSFVESCMNGTFAKTAIIAMGCSTLESNDMAKAFIEKGAQVYFGWNGSVQASHTDQATISLVEHLLTQKETAKQAVGNTMEEVGPDPAYNSQLTYYPPEAGEQTIENIGKG